MSKGSSIFLSVKRNRAAICTMIAFCLLVISSVSGFTMMRSASGRETFLPPLPDVGTLRQGMVTHLHDHIDFAANPMWVVGSVSGQVQSTDRQRIWFKQVRANTTVAARYKAYYGYYISTLDRDCHISLQGDRIVVWVRQPTVLFDAQVCSQSIRVSGRSRGTVLLTGNDRERALMRAQQPLTQIATREARQRVSRSQEARRQAEVTLKNVLLSFLGDLDPGLPRTYHNRIDVRFTDEPFARSQEAG